MLPFVLYVEKQSMLTFNKKGDDAFTSTGFKNWKNALSHDSRSMKIVKVIKKLLRNIQLL